MPLGKSHRRRSMAALSGIAAASLAVAGLALTSSPSVAAPTAPSGPAATAATAAPTKLGIRRRTGQPGAVHRDPA